MQISATRHSLRISTGRMAGCGYSFSGSDVNRDTSCPRVSRAGAGRESGEGVSTTAETSAKREAGSGGSGSAVAIPLTDAAAGPMVGARGSAVTTSVTIGAAEDKSVFTLAIEVVAVVFGASTGSGLAATDIAPRGAQLSSIGAAWVISIPGEPKPASQPATQPAAKTVPLNAARAAN